MLVDVAGIEPATPCLQSNASALRKLNPSITHEENKTFELLGGVWLAVCGCSRLLVGSLQKSLQFRMSETGGQTELVADGFGTPTLEVAKIICFEN